MYNPCSNIAKAEQNRLQESEVEPQQGQVFEISEISPPKPPQIKQPEMSKSPSRIIFTLEHSGGAMVWYQD